MNDMQSILGFFTLEEHPFAATADPAYFYATRGHKECLFRLWSGVDGCHGISVVLGHYGTGKTTLLRKLLTGMSTNPNRYNTAVIGSPIPSWTSFALLESIVVQFGLRPERRSFVSYMEALNHYLLANRERVNTLIIDDAQNLNKRGQLELLRLAQNLETPQHKLLNLVLLAQLEWMGVLRAAPNFEQRINMTYTLPPLEADEAYQLIQFRLKQAGAGANAPVFDEAAVRVIHAYAEGSPRITVTLCRNALLVAAHLKTRRVNEEIILHTIDKTTLPNLERRARAAEAVQRDQRQASASPMTPETETGAGAPSPARPRNADEERANQLLVRASRARQAETGSLSSHES